MPKHTPLPEPKKGERNVGWQTQSPCIRQSNKMRNEPAELYHLYHNHCLLSLKLIATLWRGNLRIIGVVVTGTVVGGAVVWAFGFALCGVS